jgi:Mrp family chromosome partitioning ATPase
VLLDAPPLLPVTDAALLAAQSDGLIMTVRHGKTSRDQVRIALQRVESVDGECVGMVINMAPTSGRGYGYGYGGYEPDVARHGRRKRDSGRRPVAPPATPAGLSSTAEVASRPADSDAHPEKSDPRAASASRDR